MPVLDRQAVRTRRSSRPASSGLPPRSVPEVAPTPLQRHYVLLSVIVLICGAIAITALELGVPLGSPLVKLCVLVAAPLLVVTTADASCGSGARPGRGCPSTAAKGLFRLAWVAVSLIGLARARGRCGDRAPGLVTRPP